MNRAFYFSPDTLISSLVAQIPMRQLSLHVSALNDFEYSAYTEALRDLIADDQPPSDDYQNVSVGAREVRAWLRGRYASMPLSDVDAVRSPLAFQKISSPRPQILKLFYPTLSAQDTFNAGQFFAVMRLVTHARSGKGVSKTLAFTQGAAMPTVLAQQPARIDSTPHLAHPRNDSERPLSRPTSRPQSPSKQPPPSHPSRYNGRRASYMTSISDHNPFHRGDHRDADPTLPLPPLVPPKPPTHPDVNPLVSDSTPPVIPYSAYNPFMSRSKSERRPPGQDELPSKVPPLPPRKPITLQPASPQATSIKSVPLSTNPFRPPKPSHLVSPLMKQSLEASRAGVVQRKVEENLNQERVLQVLKSSSVRNRSSSPPKPVPSSSGSSTSGNLLRSGAGSERSAPSLPPRRSAQSPSRSTPSVAGSVMSYESVANARLSLSPAKYRGNSPFSRSPERGRILGTTSTDEPRPISASPTRHTDIAPPPMHPDRKVPPVNTSGPEFSPDDGLPTSPLSPTSPKVFRSKSMGHPRPPPPPTRKSRTRPESVQLPPSSTYATPVSTPAPSPVTNGEFPLQKVTRRVSLSSTHSRASSIDSSPSVKKNLQRTFSALQPKLDAARYKVEAGLSKRGFVDHTTNARPHLIGVWGDEGERNLIGGTDTASVDNDSSSVLSYEDDSIDERRKFGYGQPRGSVVGANGGERRGRLEVDRDELKLPVSVSDGWKPL